MLPNMIKKIRNFQQNESGAVAIMFVVFANMFVGMMSLAIDLGIGYLGVSRALNASTAAALNAAIMNDTAAAKKYFGANLPSGQFGLKYDYDKDVDVEMANGFVNVIPRDFDSPTFFPLGRGQTAANSGLLQLSSISSVGLPVSVIKPADYFFVLDSSGSMGSFDSISPSTGATTSRIESVKEATLRVIDTISKGTDAAKNYGVSLVGWDHSIVASYALTSDFTAAKSYVAGLYDRGATCGACGLEEVQKYLSGSASGRSKVVIFMTDGSMNSLPSTSVHNRPQEPFNAAKFECGRVKNYSPDVTLWAITFGTDIRYDARNAQLRDQCASAPDQSVHVNNGKELDKVFGEIFNKTGKIRVLK